MRDRSRGSRGSRRRRRAGRQRAVHGSEVGQFVGREQTARSRSRRDGHDQRECRGGPVHGDHDDGRRRERYSPVRLREHGVDAGTAAGERGVGPGTVNDSDVCAPEAVASTVPVAICCNAIPDASPSIQRERSASSARGAVPIDRVADTGGTGAPAGLASVARTVRGSPGRRMPFPAGAAVSVGGVVLAEGDGVEGAAWAAPGTASRWRARPPRGSPATGA